MTFWPGFEEEEKNRMLPSQATLVGILMTMLSGILRTALSSICLKTCIFGVDPNYPRCLERQTKLFGCLMQCGGVNTNPTIMGVMMSTQVLRMVNSVRMDNHAWSARDYDVISNTI